MKKLTIDENFIEWCARIFIKIFREKDYESNNPDYYNLKYKSHKVSYIENTAWKELLPNLINNIKEKYDIDNNKEEDCYVLESLEDTLTEPEIYLLIVKKVVKKLVK